MELGLSKKCVSDLQNLLDIPKGDFSADCSYCNATEVLRSGTRSTRALLIYEEDELGAHLFCGLAGAHCNS